MSKIHYIVDWQEWQEFCREQLIDPYEYCDFSVGCRQITGGESIDFEYIGDYPEKEER